MAKSKKVEEVVEVPVVGNFLSTEQYWKWRTYACNILLNGVKYNVATGKLSEMEKDIEIARLKAQIFKLSVVKQAESDSTAAKDAYAELRKELESSLGISLNNCVIDDNTYEVRPLEQ